MCSTVFSAAGLPCWAVQETGQGGWEPLGDRSGDMGLLRGEG